LEVANRGNAGDRTGSKMGKYLVGLVGGELGKKTTKGGGCKKLEQGLQLILLTSLFNGMASDIFQKVEVPAVSGVGRVNEHLNLT